MNKLIRHYLNHLISTEIKVISFDLFDTLVFRKVLDPKYVLKLVENNNKIKNFISKEYKYSFLRKSYEQQARTKFKNVKEDISIEDIYDLWNIESTNKHNLIKLELKTENKLIFPNKELDEWIRLAHVYKKRIILISDIYLNFEQLKEIALRKIKNINLFSHFYISSEIGKLKRTGSLYDHVLKSEKIRPNEILHIGDNILSDIRIPNSKGIQTIKYGLNNSLNKVHQRERYLIRNKVGNIQFLRTSSFLKKKNYKNEVEDIFFEIGSYVFGPIINSFCSWILNLCLKNKCDQINLIMREGYFFKTILDYFKKCNNSYNTISTNTIFASKASLFKPLFDNNNVILSNLIYENLTISDIFSLCRVEIIPDTIFKHKDIPYIDSFYKEVNGFLLSDLINIELKNNIDFIKSKSKEQSDFFIKYLNQLNLSKNSILFDFGGTGSILNAINKLIPTNKPKVNCLFYENEKSFLNHFNIESFFPHKNSPNNVNDKILKVAPILESLFKLDHKTTVGYKSDSEKVYPVLEGNDFGITHLYKSFQEGVMTYIYTSSQNGNDFNNTSLEHRNTLKVILNRFLSFPTIQEANALAKLPFENDFKSLHKEQVLTIKSKQLFEKYGTEKYLYNIYSNNKFRWANTVWPELELTRNNDTILPSLSGILGSSSDTTQYLINKLISSGYTEITLYGTGEISTEILPLIKEYNIKVTNIIDSKAEFYDFMFEGQHVLSPMESILNGNRNFLIASLEYKNEMVNNLISISEKNRIEINIISCE